MKTRLIGGLAALVLAILGTALLVLYVGAADSRAQEGLDPTKVLVVSERVPAGTPVEDLRALVTTESLVKSAVAPRALTTLDGQENKIAAVDLLPGEQLLAERLVAPEDFAPGTVPVPDGLEEVTILLAPERMLGSRIAAGDHVGVYISGELEDEAPDLDRLPDEMIGFKQHTNLILQNVLVTAVQQAAPETEDSANADAGTDGVAMPNGSAFVTLALDDLNAGKVIFGAEFGSIWFTKESATSEQADPPVITIPEVVK
ncbi:Flp pilus assembly protein CpaB [Arthrobacter burdickii]|uniref:RcpC/CpaB family pilus assembly protein n=1 Tax=Arthrobacter burdickii TaxID=3035920 RepID=A0ABT8K020_9MICC|nr:RcpC/CpaB family pilus assembly protein [Arthrobacter burdickii]MDN4610766.1 RcpC/CpaB family pilus assembly protein [Arthrobacter burdickii]